MERTHKIGAQFCFFGTDAYPESLAALPDAPPVLITKGHHDLVHGRQLGIVGARNASAAGMKFTRTVAHELGEAGFIVTSGMARGIDTAAHEGALPTGTIAVMAGGMDIIYPPENAELYDRLGQGGLIICELPIGTKPLARHFPQRNRIISGLSLGVLVVEAALRSGSLITARNAAEQGREVFAVPGSPLDPRHRGTNDLIRQGATLVENAADITDVLDSPLFQRPALPLTPPELPLKAPENKAEPKNDAPPAATTDHDLVLEKLGATPIDIDELIRQSGLTAANVLTILLELELAGRLERHAGNKVALR